MWIRFRDGFRELKFVVNDSHSSVLINPNAISVAIQKVLQLALVVIHIKIISINYFSMLIQTIMNVLILST
jgi:hypothetical protein